MYRQTAHARYRLLVAEDDRCDEDPGFVDEPLGEQPSQQAGTRLDQDMCCLVAQHQFLEDGLQRQLAAGPWHAKQVHACTTQCGGPVGVRPEAVLAARHHRRRRGGGRDETPVGSDIKLRIDHDAAGDAANANAPRGEHGVVTLHRADPRENHVNATTLLVHQSAAGRVTDPSALAGAGRDAPVEGLCPLGDDPWHAGEDAAHERIAHPDCVPARLTTISPDPLGSEPSGSASRDVVRLVPGVDDPRDARRDQGLAAWTGAAQVIARLQRQVDRRAASA